VKLIRTCENDRGIPSAGHVDWVSVFAAIRQTEYNGRLTIESFEIAMGDRDTLDIAVDALERLQSSGRKVGVITHVAAMVERIAVQVVSRRSGAAFPILSFEKILRALDRRSDVERRWFASPVDP
jgi:hypothetical protein